MNKIELLAPAGSFEKAKIAFLYGADAVYMGTKSLSLRTRVSVDDNELNKTIEYAHKIGKKVYVALNIFAWDEKYEEIIEMAKKLEQLKPDGIIAADGGVIEVLKQYAPSIPINVSTQANIVSLHAANFWYKNGGKRMIPAGLHMAATILMITSRRTRFPRKSEVCSRSTWRQTASFFAPLSQLPGGL